MCRQDYGISWQSVPYHAETVHDVIEGTEVKIRSSDTHLEQGISGESQLFFLTVQEDRSRGVSGSVDDRQTMIAELNDIFISKKTSNRREVIFNADAHRRSACSFNP